MSKKKEEKINNVLRLSNLKKATLPTAELNEEKKVNTKNIILFIPKSTLFKFNEVKNLCDFEIGFTSRANFFKAMLEYIVDKEKISDKLNSNILKITSRRGKRPEVDAEREESQTLVLGQVDDTALHLFDRVISHYGLIYRYDLNLFCRKYFFNLVIDYISTRSRDFVDYVRVHR